MKSRNFLFAMLMSVSPALVLAQPATPPIPPVSAPAPPVVPVEMVAEVPSRPPQAPDAPKAPKAAVAPATPATPSAPPAPPRPQGQLLNVRIEVTLSDNKDVAKTVVLTVADGELGQNRTHSYVGGKPSAFSFNADGRPSVSGNRIRLNLTAEANVPGPDEAGRPINLRQSQTVILTDGQEIEVARAADPVSDRVFTLTVKATIQR